MIRVTRLNGKEYYINPDLIEFIESTPDTVMTMTTGKKVVVVEEIDQIICSIVEFKRKIYVDIRESDDLG